MSNPIEESFDILVTDSASANLGLFKLVANQSGFVVLASEIESAELSRWDTNVDKPRIEHQIDGLSIRIGFKRFIVDPRFQLSDVEHWVQHISPQQEISMEERNEELVSKIARLTTMLQDGQISAEEFSVLVANASGKTANQHQFMNDVKMDVLNDRADLAEYQRLWLAFLPSLAMPLALDPNPLISIVRQRRREFQDMTQNVYAITELVKQYHNIGLLAQGQLANEIARAMKKKRPLPTIASSTVDTFRKDMNAGLRPLRDFAKSMGWPEIPMI